MARRRILTVAAGATLTIAGLGGCHKESTPPLNPPELVEPDTINPPPPPPENINPPPPELVEPDITNPPPPELLRSQDTTDPRLLEMLPGDTTNPPSPGVGTMGTESAEVLSGRTGGTIPELQDGPGLPPPPPGIGPTTNPPPPGPGDVPTPVRPELLPTWSEVGSGYPPQATNPPIPELIVTPSGECYKNWRAARLAPRPDRPLGDRVQECAPGDCGTRIQCPEDRAQALLRDYRAAGGE